MFKEILFVSFLFHGLICCYGDTSANSSTSKLILVSFDGFRADYLTKFPLPNLNAFIKEGVLVEHVKNVFITKTFPNHYSLVTGLYAESHGFVANSMYDPEIKRVFTLANSSDPVWWNEATPIWVTNQLQGHKSGSGMWPGSEVYIHNMTIDNMKYNRNVSFAERVDTVASWFTRAKDPINFATLYWEEPDSSGHHFGPDDHKNMTEVLRSVDENVGYLMSKLKNLSLWDSVNVIITSDHGMAELSKDRVIELDKCIGRENYTLVDDTPVAAILPLQDKMYVYGLLKDCHPNMKAYLKEDIPERYHYKHNSRIQPIILVADLGWTIMQNGSLKNLGNHGYDNEFPSMHPFLAARGPAFHKGYKMDTINSVDVYPMMCHILRLKAEPNNGTLANTKCLLVDEWCIHMPEAIGIVIGVIMVLTTLTCVIVLLKKKLPSARPFSRLEFQEDDDPLIG